MHYNDEWGNKYELKFFKATYQMGGLAVLAYCKEDGNDYWEPYGDVTVWLFAPKSDYEYCAYLDTNNDGRLVKAMVDAGYVTLTGRTTRSGWCEYPEGRFDKEWLDSLKVMG